MQVELQIKIAKIILAILIVLSLVAVFLGYSAELPDSINRRDLRLWNNFPSSMGMIEFLILWSVRRLELHQSEILLSGLLKPDVEKSYRRLLPPWKKSIAISVISSLYWMSCWFLLGALLTYWGMYHEYVLEADQPYEIWGKFTIVGAPVFFIARSISIMEKGTRRAVEEGGLGAEEQIKTMNPVYGRKQRGGKSIRRRHLEWKRRQRNDISNDRDDSI